MGITQGMEPAGRAPTVLGSPFPGIPGPCVQGRGHGGTPEHRETPPVGLSNLGVRNGVHREREGDEQDFLSAAGSAPAGGILFLCSPQLHPLLWGSWSGGASSPGYWRGAEPFGPAPCAWYLPSLTSCGCAKGGGPQGRCGSTEGTPMLLCPQMAGDTTQAGDRAGLGHTLLLSLPWGSWIPQVPGSLCSPRAGVPPWHLYEPGPFLLWL